MTKILVTGASGQLGMALRRVLHGKDLVLLDRSDVDLSDGEALESAIGRIDFDVLINAAAYTAVDLAEDHPQEAALINGVAPGVLAAVCQSKGALMVQISTDYVFGDKPPLPIQEDADPNPDSVYGKSKLEGEYRVKQSGAEHAIIRTSWLYGPDGRNFLKTMQSLSDAGKHPSVVFDQVGTPTFVDHLAGAIDQVCNRYERSQDQFPSGTYHYSNEGVASWYDFACAIFELSGSETSVLPVRSAAFPTKATRPAYSVLDKQKIKNTFDLEIPHWRNGLEKCLALMKKPL